MLSVLLLAVQAAAPASPLALPPLHGGPASMTCPVGGERFSAWRPTHWSSYGERPDGRPYSYLSLPFPIPECPSNKLLLFADFSPAEVERLPALIGSPAYRQLVADETPYFRAAWLAEQLGRPAAERLWLLNTAGWEVKGGTLASSRDDRRAGRYLETFARAVAAMPASVTGKDRVALLARGANAWRELGRFDAAEQMRRQAAEALAPLPAKGGWDRYLDRLGVVIARRDAALEPVDMVPAQVAPQVCASRSRPTRFERHYCAAPPSPDR